ncbi:MAG: hypothetical protein U1F49_02460 [Rubrivivax sp.]
MPARVPWWPRWRAKSAAAAPARGIAEAALPEGEADLLWSNMVLHHQAAPLASMQR